MNSKCPLDTDGDGDCPACAHGKQGRSDCVNGILVDPLEKLVARLAETYRQYKEFDTRLNGESKSKKNRKSGLKEEFFDEATKASATTLAEKTTLILKEDAPDDESARIEAARRYPGWTVESVKYDGPGMMWRIRIKEDPRYKPFTYVDEANGLVWTRQISAGSAEYDIDKLQREDPELWERVSKLERVPKALESLPSEDLTKVQRYIYPGTPKVSLAAPKKAKPEDLND